MKKFLLASVLIFMFSSYVWANAFQDVWTSNRYDNRLVTGYALGDIDNDGLTDIIVGTKCFIGIQGENSCSPKWLAYVYKNQGNRQFVLDYEMPGWPFYSSRLADMDNGVINPGDCRVISANLGQCTSLPDWQTE